MKTNGRQVLEKLLLCGKYQFFEIGSKGSELKK
jgi:hypothetical protein